MSKVVSGAVLALGIVLIIYGLSASHSIASDFSRFFTGSPTNKTLWMLIGGIIASVIGLFGLARRTAD
ncbi:MAG: DUF3185 family protein [Limisphaerales bacterium]